MLFIGFSNPATTSDDKYSIEYATTRTNRLTKVSFQSQESFDHYLNNNEIFSTDEDNLQCTVTLSAGSGSTYVRVTVTGDCDLVQAEARRQLKAAQASVEEASGSLWDSIKDWWNKL